MDSKWFCVVDGQSVGPITQAETLRYLSSGKISKDSLVWADGMGDWAPLSSVPELIDSFPPPLSVVAQVEPAAEAQPAANPAGAALGDWSSAAPRSFGAAGGPAFPSRGASHFSPGPSRRHAGAQANAAAALADSSYSSYPFADCAPKKVNFLILVGCLCAPMIAVLMYLGSVAVVSGFAVKAMAEGGNLAEYGGYYTFWAVISWLFGLAGVAAAFFYSAVVISRAWLMVQANPNVQVSPVQAAAFFLIPIFNLYGIFVALNDWSKRYNEIVEACDLTDAPPVNENLFKWTCVSYVAQAIPILNIFAMMAYPVLSFLAFFQMCKAVNYFSEMAASGA